MTLVIELEQRFQSVAQVDRRGLTGGGLGCRTTDASRRLKCERGWPKKKRVSEDGRTETSGTRLLKRDLHNPQDMMTAIDTPIPYAAETPPRRKE